MNTIIRSFLTSLLFLIFLMAFLISENGHLLRGEVEYSLEPDTIAAAQDSSIHQPELEPSLGRWLSKTLLSLMQRPERC